jgi:hypothetical protein
MNAKQVSMQKPDKRIQDFLSLPLIRKPTCKQFIYIPCVFCCPNIPVQKIELDY